MSTAYASVKAMHASSPAFSPPVGSTTLGYIAFFFLLAFFSLSFLFTTLPKSRNPLPELGTALGASILAGVGTVALFCTLGVISIYDLTKRNDRYLPRTFYR